MGRDLTEEVIRGCGAGTRGAGGSWGGGGGGAESGGGGGTCPSVEGTADEGAATPWLAIGIAGLITFTGITAGGIGGNGAGAAG